MVILLKFCWLQAKNYIKLSYQLLLKPHKEITIEELATLLWKHMLPGDKKIINACTKPHFYQLLKLLVGVLLSAFLAIFR